MPEIYKLTDEEKEFLLKLPITNEQLEELFIYMNEYEHDKKELIKDDKKEDDKKN